MNMSGGEWISLHPFYEGVPPDQVEGLRRFRAEHHVKRIDVEGVEWEYIACGDGPEVLLIQGLLPIAGLLPERMLMWVFRRSLSSIVTVQEVYCQFWDAYLEELFDRRLTKGDLLSQLRTTRDAYMLYA